MSRRRGGAGGGGGLRIKRRARGFMCGCGGAKAVSISDGSEKSPMATPQTAASATPLTGTAIMSAKATATRAVAWSSGPAEAPSSFTSSSGLYAADTVTTTDDGPSSSMESTPSLSALLRQLRELERSVRSLHAANSSEESAAGARRHRRAASEGCGGGSGRVEESVAVVKESADPLGDFRRSMLQMIVEKEIVGGAELRELLHRFLSLNAPRHHHLILRAFAEIWEEVFAGYEDQRTPEHLAAAASRPHHTKKLPAARGA
ncbi:hypothetical protein U9M48_007834 [Paspalum notatum var. saurae]|uniref:Transcription repressor n=1 Tax=Paspalum notatum var. saurae TaxID=547442 RepID=A0AAQ3SMX6_PASNO